MVRHVLILVLAGVLAMTGCARQHQTADEPNQGGGNLDPELAELNHLKFSRGRPLTDEEKQVLSANADIVFHLTNEESEQVKGLVQYFLETKRDTIKRWLTRAEPHLQYVSAVLASHKLPQDLMALPFIESGYNCFAYSSSGAGGMWQFMPATGRRFGLRVDYWVDERRNPYLATMAAAKYLSELHGRFGDWQLALAGYNAGEGKVSRAMAASGSQTFKDLAKDETWLREETRNYVPKFLAMVKILKNLKQLGFAPVDLGAAPSVKEISVPGGTDLAALAQACGMDWEQFRQLNPAFRRQVSPPEENSPVYLPTARIETAQAYLRQPGRQKAGYKMMAAGRGDTWWKISSATGVPITALRRLNPGASDTLAPGQAYYLPADSSPLDANFAAAAPYHEPNLAEHKPIPYSQTLKAEGVGKIATNMSLAKDQSKSKGKPSLQTLAYSEPAQSPSTQPQPRQYAQSRNAGSAMHAIAASAGDGRGATAKAVSNKMPQNPTSSQQTKPATAQAMASPAAKQHGPADSGKAKNKYMVAKGETVWSIARKLNVNPHSLLAANNLTTDSHLREGDSLYVDGR